MPLTGKGFFTWKLPMCEGGNPTAIAQKAAAAGLTHVVIKIADGTRKYPISGPDLNAAVTQALHAAGLQVWGWHYVYGDNPIGEARTAIEQVRSLGLDGYVIDAETEYKQTSKEAAATAFMDELRAGLPATPVALSSYRYPSYHRIPWSQFLAKCDYNMPQVYWEQSHNPAPQLERSVRELTSLSPSRPVIPTGAAYGTTVWRASPEDLRQFFQKALDLGLTAANAYSWDYATSPGNTDLWDAVAAFNWPGAAPSPAPPSPAEEPTPVLRPEPAEGPPPEPVEEEVSGDVLQQFFAALNTHNPAAVAALYNHNAGYVTARGMHVGPEAIRGVYAELFGRLPEAVFTLLESSPSDPSGKPHSRTFTWRAAGSTGTISDGSDTMALVNGRIQYHFSSYRFTPAGG